MADQNELLDHIRTRSLKASTIRRRSQKARAILPRYNTSDYVPIGEEHVYVGRPETPLIETWLSRPGERPIIAVCGCRQNGKTSLIHHEIVPLLQAKGWTCEWVDLRVIETIRNYRDLTVAYAFSRSLETDDEPDSVIEAWRERYEVREFGREPSNAVQAIAELLRRKSRDAKGHGWALVLDELDVLDGRRGAIATLVNAVAVARQDPEVRSRLVLVTASLISLGDMTSETMAMDIGKILNLIAPILIGDFTLEPATIRGLAKGLPNSVDRDAIVEKVLTETGGQPHLTNLLLDRIQSRLIQDASIWDPTTLVTNEVGLLVEAAQTQRSPDFDHFLYAEQYLEKRLDVALLALEYFRSAQRSWPAPVIDPPNNDRIEWLLELTGLMKRSGTGFKIRSPIYRNVYSEQWIDRRRDILADRQSGADRSSSGPVLVVREHLPWIALLNCGGTLGMEKQADGIRAPDDLVIYLQSFSKIGDLARVHPVLNVPINDSANVAPADWGEIAKRIFETWKRFKDENTPLAGFVVAFGTDTLAHAAMGVALALGPALPVPVVFTGAQAPASALHGDAAANLARAAHVATEFGFKIDARQQPQAATLPEVIVVFGDHLYRGVRVEKRDDALFQGFHSPGYGPIGTIAEKVRLVPGYRPKDSSKTLPTDYWTPKPSFDRRVLLVSQYPGMVPTYFMDLLDATQRAGAPFTTDNPAPPFEQAPNLVRGVVIESLGVGNLPTRPSLSLLDFIRKSVALQIPVAVTARIPIQLDFVDAYEPARSAKEAGAKLVGSMTTAAVITKMMWLLSQADAGEGLREGQTIAEYVQTELETNYVGELGQP